MTIAGILIPIIYIIISSYIIWKSTDGFETAADYLGRKMSRGVKGATLNAVASSMPEFLSTIFFLFYVRNEGQFADSFSGGLGVTAGSAVFNILIIPSAILFFGVFSNKGISSFPLNRHAISRDGIFLIVANILLIFMIRQRILGPLDGAILVIIYLFYLLLLRKGFGKNSDFDDSVYRKKFPKVKIGAWHVIQLNIKEIVLNDRHLTIGRAWFLLIFSTAIMSGGTWLLVEGTELLGHDEYTLFGIKGLKGLGFPIIFISVLLASAATSIPDTMISIRDARKGNHIDSISNALGSNIFDISFAIGLPILIYTMFHGSIEMSEKVRVWSLSVWVFMALINLLVVPLFIFSKRISRKMGIILLIIYLLFILFIIEENTRFSFVSDTVERYLL